MKAILTNRRAEFIVSPSLQKRLKKFFRYSSPGAQFSPKFRMGLWDGYVNLLRWSKVASGLFISRQSLIEKKLKRQFEVIDKRVFPKFVSAPTAIAEDKYGHQDACVDAMVRASNLGGLVICATGTGKTRIAAKYFQRLKGHGCFIVESLLLLEQARNEISTFLGEEVGVIGRGEFDPKRITVATVQTLSLHQKDSQFKRWFRDLEVLIIDEIHIALNSRDLDVVKTVGPKAVFGLTASLQLKERSVKLRAIELAGPPIFEFGIAEGHAKDILTKGLIFRLPVRTNCTYRPNYREAYSTLIVNNQDRNKLIQHVAKLGVHHNRVVAILVERRAHLAILDQMFRKIPHVVLSGEIPISARLFAVKKVKQGSINLILASRVFFTGIDLPRLDMIIDATASPGWNGAIQRYGRGVRKFEGKEELIYVDISDKGVRNPFERKARLRASAWQELEGVEIRDITEAESIFTLLKGSPARQQQQAPILG